MLPNDLQPILEALYICFIEHRSDNAGCQNHQLLPTSSHESFLMLMRKYITLARTFSKEAGLTKEKQIRKTSCGNKNIHYMGKVKEGGMCLCM